MSRLAKVSKYRHTGAAPFKADLTFRDLKVCCACFVLHTCATPPPSQVMNQIWDCSNLVDANMRYVAFAWASGGGGKIVVKDHSKPEKSAANPPALVGM